MSKTKPTTVEEEPLFRSFPLFGDKMPKTTAWDQINDCSCFTCKLEDDFELAIQRNGKFEFKAVARECHRKR